MNMITACIDGSKISAYVCDAAAWVSLALNTPVKLLHVLEKTIVPVNDNLSGAIGLGSREHLLADMTALDEQRSKIALEHGKHMLEDARLRVQNLGVANVQVKQRHGELLEALAESENDTRVFVMGRLGEGHDVASKAIGAHLENAVRAIHTPILVTVGEFTPPKTYMIAYDGSATADEAIAKLSESALLKNLPAHLVMVASNTAEHLGQLNAAQEILSKAGRQVTARLLEGSVQESLNLYRENNKIDLMVMGAYGHSRLREFFVGSQTSKMIARSPIPLLLLR
jgi:nucleotide-binding universal stress UspA family protein